MYQDDKHNWTVIQFKFFFLISSKNSLCIGKSCTASQNFCLLETLIIYGKDQVIEDHFCVSEDKDRYHSEIQLYSLGDSSKLNFFQTKLFHLFLMLEALALMSDWFT